MAGFNDAPLIQVIAVPAVCLLIVFLGYGSQLVFLSTSLDPGPPSSIETAIFNGLLLVLWYTYYKAVTVDPGRYVFPEVIEAEGRWCKKCSTPKPLRSHHCRHCNRCVPKMDHHCPWTANCVSMTTFPHFLRFLVYTNVALWALDRLIFQRFYALWESRNLPAYLGPTLPTLIALAVVGIVAFVTSVALGIMLITTLKSWMFNMTMIEGWELDRHDVVADRAGKDWWDVVGPDGDKIRFEKLEFPYDIGILSNMSQAMGTTNPLLWLSPFAGSPTISKDGKGTGWEWEENGFNRTAGLWPPPDPEKLRRAGRPWPAARRDYEAELRQVGDGTGLTDEADATPDERKAAFLRRQQADLKRQKQLIAELEEVEDYDMLDDDDEDMNGNDWTNTDGERLRDYGVDEDADEELAEEAAQDEDVPLAELIRRRKVRQRDDED
ncbi:DHHC palmitoyltransferase domain-containing protein [Sarocladium implicatum]|nr:DHHC palmitoyltransferase domain-containing protein [Sarocladium implicatum]